MLDDTNNSVVFVNQISGVTPSGFNIDPLCYNPTDMCIQCSPNGPDQWPDGWSVGLPPVPEKTIRLTCLTDEMLGCPSFMKNKSGCGPDRYPQWPRYDNLHAEDQHDSAIAVVAKLLSIIKSVH